MFYASSGVVPGVSVVVCVVERSLRFFGAMAGFALLGVMGSDVVVFRLLFCDSRFFGTSTGRSRT